MTALKFTVAATIATSAIALGFVGSAPVDAAIVTGTVSGMWEYPFTEISPGDTFTATYTYDDANPYTTNESSTDYRYFSQSFSLLSLIVNSDSLTQVFDLTPGVGSGFVEFSDYALSPPTYSPYSNKGIIVSASSYSNSVSDAFYASKDVSQRGGAPFINQLAQGYSYDYSTGQFGSVAATYGGLTFSQDPTAVPTPALLPGLVGLGLGVLRKRKAAATNAEG